MMSYRAKNLLYCFLIAAPLILTHMNCSGYKGDPGLTLSSNSKGTVTLTWDANSETDLAGYRVYYGKASDQLVNVKDLGLTASPQNPQAILGDLAEGELYYFVLRAYNSGGLESIDSNLTSTVVR